MTNSNKIFSVKKLVHDYHGPLYMEDGKLVWEEKQNASLPKNRLHRFDQLDKKWRGRRGKLKRFWWRTIRSK